MKPDNPDLFEWAANRPTGQVIDIVSILMLRAWEDRTKPIAHLSGDLVNLHGKFERRIA